MEKVVNIIGGGYAGCEAALTLAKYGVQVHLFDVPNDEQPLVFSEKDKLLKEELFALKVETAEFLQEGEKIKEKLMQKVKLSENIRLFEGIVGEMSLIEPTIIATGGSTKEPLFSQFEKIFGAVRCHRDQPVFPVVTGIDDKIKNQNGVFYLSLTKEKVDEFCKAINYFRAEAKNESLEKWAQAGREMLRAKALRPIVSDKVEYACLKFIKTEKGFLIQNFQTALPDNAQLSLFKFLLGENVEVVQFASFVACTYINPQLTLNEFLQAKANPNLFFAGRIVMTNGVLQAIGTGHYVALNMLNFIHKRKYVKFPEKSLLAHSIDKLFLQGSFNCDESCEKCDIIKSQSKIVLDQLKKFKEDYNARNAWHNDLCGKKRW